MLKLSLCRPGGAFTLGRLLVCAAASASTYFLDMLLIVADRDHRSDASIPVAITARTGEERKRVELTLPGNLRENLSVWFSVDVVPEIILPFVTSEKDYYVLCV